MLAKIDFDEVMAAIFVFAFLTSMPMFTRPYAWIASFLLGKQRRQAYLAQQNDKNRPKLFIFRDAVGSTQIALAFTLGFLWQYKVDPEANIFGIFHIVILLYIIFVVTVMLAITIILTVGSYFFEYYIGPSRGKLLSFTYLVMVLHSLCLPMTAYWVVRPFARTDSLEITHPEQFSALSNEPHYNKCTSWLERIGARDKEKLDRQGQEADVFLRYEYMKYNYFVKKYVDGVTYDLADNFGCNINDVELTHKNDLFNIISTIYSWLVSAFSLGVLLAPFQKLSSHFSYKKSQ